MKKRFIKSLAALSSAVLLFGAVAQPVDYSFKFENNSSIMTADAAPIYSGSYGGRLTAVSAGTNANGYVYVDVVDSKTKTAKIVGSSLGSPNTTVFIPETVKIQNTTYTITEIGDNAFKGQKNLEYIIPVNINKFNRIGNSAFANCTELKRSLNANTIGNYAFANCYSLSSITLYDTSYIGEYAYAGCSSVTSIDLKNTKITNIYNHTFAYCSLVEKILLPDTLKYIGDYAFTECGAFSGYSNLFNQIYIPDSVTSIGNSAFRSCRNLQTVMMSENIRAIGEYAFYGCDMMNYFVCKNPKTLLGEKSIGFDNNRCYTGKKKNFIIWGTGGIIEEYAHDNGFTYYDCSEAVGMANKKLKDKACEWNAINNKKNWAQKENWLGACVGLSATSALVYNDVLEVKDFCPEYSTISSIPYGNVPSVTKTFINSMQALQNKTAVDYIYSDLTKESIRYIEYLTYAQKADIFAHGLLKGGHAIFVYGLEYKDNASDKANSRWNGMNARILVSDCNKTMHGTKYHIYINTNTDEWRYTLGDGKDDTYDNTNTTYTGFSIGGLDIMFTYDKVSELIIK